VLEFAREFGLILFVYTIGMQVGPGFVASLRQTGLPLNLLAATVVVLGMLLTIAAHLVLTIPLPAAAGVMSGAVTNTPSLAAAQEALRSTPGIAAAEVAPLTATGYAVAYPFGIVGIILAMVVIRRTFGVDVEEEARVAEAATDPAASVDPSIALATANLEVRNANLRGLPLADVPTLERGAVTISRLLRNGEAMLATGDIRLDVGDVLLAVGPRRELDELRLVVGREAAVDVRAQSSNLSTRRVIVTRREVLGKSLAELDLRERFGVTATRINRAGVDLPAKGVRLQFGDNVLLVGDPAAIAFAAPALGDSTKRLNHPQVIAVFVGIILGVLIGSLPIAVPGMPAPLKLGLAGGPLIVAILLSRLGNVGPVVFHLPISANLMLRDLGIVLFLACVGLKGGDGFFDTAFSRTGAIWMAAGAAITFVPLIAVAIFARVVMEVNYATLCGLLAGSMTDPPALQFATAMTNTDAPNVSYATVYPLVMLLRVIGAQVLVILLA
jgi:putative transport protein